MQEESVVAACIPAFNEEATIARVVLLAERYVDQVFVCDDGSTDMSGIIAEAWAPWWSFMRRIWGMKPRF